jgi:acetyltransferase-like isoleucine patch superfamily enzyme
MDDKPRKARPVEYDISPPHSVRKRDLPGQELLSLLPTWRSVTRLRAWYCRRKLKDCGDAVDISQGVIFEFPERISLGRRVFINRGTIITARADIVIGDDALIGPYVIINSGDHIYEDPGVPINQQGHKYSPIVIERDVWIGAHAMILSGVRIGQGSVIAAGAVVTSDVPPFVVAAGKPARVIKKRGEPFS